MKADTYTTYTTLIPSFYTDVFKEQDVLNKVLQGVDLIQMQASKDSVRNAEFSSVAEAEPLHTTVTETLHLTKSARTSITYGSGIDYGDTDVDYGDQASSVYGIYDLGDRSIKSVGYVADGVNNPTYIYTEGIDFFVDNGLLVFVTDASTLFPQLQDADADGLIDEPDFKLIGHNVRRDRQDISRQFGYIFGISAPPTTSGQDVFKGLWKLFTFGPSWYWTMYTLCRALGSDVIRTKKEVVIATKTGTPYGNVVITQNNTYITSSSPASVDTTLYYGYPVSTDIDVLHELEGVFEDDIPGVTDLPDNGDSTQAYGAITEEGSTLYLLPENLILIELAPGLSDNEAAKLIDVFEAVLAKNTKMIIIFGVQANPLYSNVDPDRNNDPLAIETVIIEATTSTDSNKSTSKLKMSTR
jgi:hypothetical protein